MMDLFITNMQLFASQDVNWWTWSCVDYLWIIKNTPTAIFWNWNTARELNCDWINVLFTFSDKANRTRETMEKSKHLLIHNTYNTETGGLQMQR